MATGSGLPLHKEYWRWIKGLYKVTFNCTPPPAWVTLERITADRIDLYLQVPPPGGGIPVYIYPFQVEE